MYRKADRERLERIEHRMDSATKFGEEKWQEFYRRIDRRFDEIERLVLGLRASYDLLAIETANSKPNGHGSSKSKAAKR